MNVPLISIVMPCFNAAKFLDKAVQSLEDQIEKNWELIIVNDGSTDESEAIGQKWAKNDERIRVISKPNEGYVSARLIGYTQTKQSKYVIFFDADDKMHPQMLQRLSGILEDDPSVGAAYCNHRIMDEQDVVSVQGIEMPRFIPNAFWVKQLPEEVSFTPFISIFCWTKMIEPMTLIRRVAYDQTPGWDIDFGKGKGNIGEGVYLFAEIALRWKVYYEKQPLYYYRRHSTQISAVPDTIMKRQVDKVIGKWNERIVRQKDFSSVLKPAIIFLKYRLAAKKMWGSFPHQLKNNPVTSIVTIVKMLALYTMSVPLIFSYRRLLKNELHS